MQKKLLNVFAPENIGAGWLYFYIHMMTEIASFYILSNKVGDSAALWAGALLYDCLAFVPQALIGVLSDRLKRFSFGLVGTGLMILSLLNYGFDFLPGKWTAIVLMALGNACVHVNGAQVTLRASKGKLSHSAVFVGGGSFGVVIGKLLAKNAVPFWAVTLFTATILPFIMLAECYRYEADKDENPCESFRFNSARLSPGLVLAFAVFVVVVRAYMGYGIPTSWNKTMWQTVMLFVAMGVGKAAGGIVADAVGVRKTAIISAAAALPFLLFGDKYMAVSLIGVALFSMTMSITLALIVSVLPSNPGLAFGFTTIGLFLGTVPTFFAKVSSFAASCAVIVPLTVLSLVFVTFIISKEGSVRQQNDSSIQ